jgi:2-dehydro-3-deoxygluconokinase
MSNQAPAVVCVGEATMELSRGGDGRFGLACGGDTFHVAVYLARAGIGVGLMTALGDDPYSDAILALAAAEGVSCNQVLRARGRPPALSVIDGDGDGAHRRCDWRGEAPARELFELPDWARVAAGLMRARLIYFSGITLSLYSNSGLGRFLAVIEMARKEGTKIAFDANFRPQGWSGNLARARAVFVEALKRIDMALPAYDDEAVLWGDPSPEATVERLQAFDIAEIVVKNGPNGALVAAGKQCELVPVPEVVVPVDPTAAGDAFNAAYIAARISGRPAAEAAASAHRLAAQVISHRGALTPRAAAAMH